MWNTRLPRVAFIILNPSTADAQVDVPTIRRCVGFARSWHDGAYGGIDVVNLYAFRTAYPRELFAYHGDPVGADNDSILKAVAEESGMVIAAWGARAKADRVRQVCALLPRH